MVVLWIKADWNLIGMTLVSAELIAGGNDIMICRQKGTSLYLIRYEILISQIGKPLGCLIFFWVGDGPERQVVV